MPTSTSFQFIHHLWFNSIPCYQWFNDIELHPIHHPHHHFSIITKLLEWSVKLVSARNCQDLALLAARIHGVLSSPRFDANNLIGLILYIYIYVYGLLSHLRIFSIIINPKSIIISVSHRYRQIQCLISWSNLTKKYD